MRLLVTNTHALQAYAITRCLRPHAERVVATLSGTRPLGFWPADHAAYSRLVDKRYRVPDPEADWLAGRIQAENTALESRFIARIQEICALEKIDTIFPSSDAWVYVFAKNKALFKTQGIVIPVPDLDTVMTPLDKYETIKAARKVGFPCPDTYLAESDEAVRRIASELSPPWVIKPRFTNGGRGMAFVEDAGELVRKCRETRARHGIPMIQGYIPGHQRESYYLVLDHGKRVVSAATVHTRRRSTYVFGDQPSASETVPTGPLLEKAVALAHHINWWGGMTVQYKVDPRDGLPKLMEINPRLGIHLWFRTEMGMNEPLMCLQIARGETPASRGDYPYGCLLLKPFEDLVCLPLDLIGLAIYRFRAKVLKRKFMDPLAAEMSMENRFGCYWEDYFGDRERRLSPYFAYALEDPLPLVVWSSKLAASALDGLGRRALHLASSIVNAKPGKASARAGED